MGIIRFLRTVVRFSKTVVGCCLLILIATFILVKPEKRNWLNVERDKIDSIVVYNRGDFSTFDQRRIVNQDTIRAISRLITTSEWVPLDSAGVKSGVRLGRFNLFEGDDVKKFSYTITYDRGNIIWYAGDYYRSDSLYQYLK